MGSILNEGKLKQGEDFQIHTILMMMILPPSLNESFYFFYLGHLKNDLCYN